MIKKATLWSAALALAVSLSWAPRAAAQDRDNQQITPSQNNAGQPADMQHPDTPGEPGVNNQDEQRQMDRREDRDQDRDRTGAWQGRDKDKNNDAMQREAATFDQFLDKHPELAEDLHRNPSLVNDQQYVSQHKALEEFLENHPKLRDEIRENPQAFMGQERNHDRHENEKPDQQRPPRL